MELVILDDASPTEKAKEAILELLEVDSRVRAFKSKVKLGAAEARNFCIKKAKGKFIALSDSDDISHTERIRFQV